MNCYGSLADVYDMLINCDISYKDWASVILNLCDNYKVDKTDYLDLACGTGNLTVEFLEHFKHIWAMDMSSEMLTIAEDKVRERGHHKAKFICQDMCNLNLNKNFDLVTCCLDSVNYIVDKEKLKDFFKGVSQCLKDKGIFIFDINSAYKLREVLGNNIYNYDNDDVVYIWENSFENDIVEMYITFFIKEGEYYRRFDEEHYERAYKMDEIVNLLNECGLSVVKLLDNYEDTEIKEDTERITFVVRKQ